jgi:WD40 repeat protein
LHRFTGHRGQVRCVAISRDGRFALSGGEDGTARLWQLPGSGPPPQPVVRPGPVGEIRRFDTQPGAVLSLAYSPDGSQALAGCGDQTIRLWDVQTGRELKRFKSLAGDVISVAFAGPGKILFGGSNKSIRTLDQVTGQEVDRMGIHGAWVYPPDFSPDRRRALNPMSDKSFWLWDLETRKPVLELQGHTTTVVCAAFSPDARLAVSGSSDKTVRVWDLATGKELKTFFGHGSTITGVAFAPDGRHVLSGSRDKTLRWWSVETGNEVLCLKGHADAVQAIAISPTGRHAVSGSGGTWLGNKYVPGTEHLLRLWDLQTGQEIARFQGHTGDINCIAFSPDGRTFLSGSADMTVRLWQFPAPGPVPSQDLLPGLAATFFEGGEWEKGKVAVQQVDPNVSYYWGMKDPHPGLSVSNFSARWVGVLKILQPGRYTFAITADDSGSLWIDGKLLIDGKRDLRAYRGQAEIELVPGDHEIRLECFNRVGGAFCGLRWSLKDGFAEQFVPPDVLFHRPR